MTTIGSASNTTPTSGAAAIAAHLVSLGVRHVFGVGGANIEDLFLAIQRRRPEMMVILAKHEHSAGTAADAYSRVSRSLGVVMTTSGGGAMNLVSALAESFASRVPVLAIVGEPPTSLQGRGAFQDTSGRAGSVDALSVFRAVSAWCQRATSARDLIALLEAAARTALEESAPAVLLVAKDLQQARVDSELGADLRRATAAAGQSLAPCASAPDPEIIGAALRLLTERPIAIVAGAEVPRSGAQPDLMRLATALDAQVAVTPDARDAFDNRDARFAGVAGAMGHERAARVLDDARVCLLVGTRLPILARQGHEAILEGRPLVCIAREAPFISSREVLHLGGDLAGNLRSLVSTLESRCSDPHAMTPLPSASADVPSGSEMPFGSAAVLRIVRHALPENGVVLIDAGNTGAYGVHCVRAPSRGHWLVAMGMAGMGYTFGGAIGAAFATGARTLVLAGDGAFFMHGLEVHTAVQHTLPITYVIFDNRAHGMCLLRERLLLGEDGGYNAFLESNIGAGLAAMFPGLDSSDCRTVADLERAVARAATVRGPSVIAVHLPEVEVPPFAAFHAALAARGALVEGPATS